MSCQLELDSLRKLTLGVVGILDVSCPLCGPDRRSAANQKRRVLRIWDDGAFVTYKCARCDASGWATDSRAAGAPARQISAKPAADDQDRVLLARLLWSRAQPVRGSLAESYLHARGCFIDSPSLRCLPPRAHYPAAMAASFGDGTLLSGVHLTRLAPDGSAKAGTEKDKIMIGPSLGQPIIVQNNPERGELILAEGIEDAASLALVTGWTAWAAGSAGRIAACIPAASHFDRIFLAVDDDKAAMRALDRARAIRRDIIPLSFGKIFGRRVGIDANRALQSFGAAPILAAIEWAEAQARFRLGEIGFHAMQAAMARADRVFGDLPGAV